MKQAVFGHGLSTCVLDGADLFLDLSVFYSASTKKRH